MTGQGRLGRWVEAVDEDILAELESLLEST
jgi:hypothetical protein